MEKYIVIKEPKSERIIYMEYEKIKGLDINPKQNLSFEDMININQMIIINPSLIKKLVEKKCKKKIEKIIKMLSFIFENDEDSGDTLDLALDELHHFKVLLKMKYKEHLDEKEYDLLMKKIEILEYEANIRKQHIYNLINEKEQGKGR